MTIITINHLSEVIAERLDVDIETARRYASIVIDFFGYHDRIIDNILNPGERQLFYSLQEQKILSTEREEITLYNGNIWRTHYWRLERESILDYFNNKKPRKDADHEVEMMYKDLYSKITKDMWTTRKTPDL